MLITCKDLKGAYTDEDEKLFSLVTNCILPGDTKSH